MELYGEESDNGRPTFLADSFVARHRTLVQSPRDSFDREDLYHVFKFNVVVIGQPDATLESLVDLGCVFFETLEARYFSFVNDHIVSQQPR